MARPLFEMFNAVPQNYDLLNTLMTWGMDKGWRRTAAKKCVEQAPGRILDICCGTGDLSYTVSRMTGKETEIISLDYSPMMLAEARQKFTGLTNEPKIINGDASKLPFPNDTFDCVGISFAFRNLTYKNPKIAQHLSEIFRVVKPGGRFVIVESSQPEIGIIRTLFHLYLRVYVATIGALISKNKGAYSYLAVSAANFYTPKEIKKLLTDTGFKSVDYKAFFFGAAGIHVAVK